MIRELAGALHSASDPWKLMALLQMLATHPRRKWDEFTWAALTGTISAAPSAAQAIWSAYQRSPFSLQAFEFVQVAICGGFFVWFLARLGAAKQS